MAGHIIDVFRAKLKRKPQVSAPGMAFIATDYGEIRLFDTGGDKPVLITVPDGPNVIEHHLSLIAKLSKNFRVICFEFPGFGFSRPSFAYDYSFTKSTALILNVMDILKIDRAALSFSCSNGFYAIKAAQMAPDRISRLFLAQTPSLHSMEKWTAGAVPKILTLPIIGQVTNAVMEKKLAHLWYHYALPKDMDKSAYQETARRALNSGGCFCLSGLVQGLQHEIGTSLQALDVPATLIWGRKDHTHCHTDSQTITDHLPQCEVITFDNCAHFPELENPDRYVTLVNERG